MVFLVDFAKSVYWSELIELWMLKCKAFAFSWLYAGVACQYVQIKVASLAENARL